jgi:hypothetical protein
MRWNPEHPGNLVEHFHTGLSLPAFDETQVARTNAQLSRQLSLRQTVRGSDDPDCSTKIHRAPWCSKMQLLDQLCSRPFALRRFHSLNNRRGYFRNSSSHTILLISAISSVTRLREAFDRDPPFISASNL